MRLSIFISKRSVVFGQQLHTFDARDSSNMNTVWIFLERDKNISYKIDFIIPLETLDPMVISQLFFLFFGNKEKLSGKERILWMKNRKRESITRTLPLQTIFSGRPHIYSPDATLCL